MTRTLVVFGDIHCPIEDRKLVRSFISFMKDYQPDELVCIGDLMDLNQPSRWAKDTKAEFEGSVFLDAKHTRERVLEPLREVYDGPFGFICGNHDSRGTDYLRRFAPALGESTAFDPDVLLDFPSLDITTLQPFYEFHRDWVMTHGHLGGIRLTQEAGRTALNASVKFQKNVVHGHTHRLGATSKSFGYGSEVHKVFTGVETGHMIDMRLAGYLKQSTANWQSGFCVIHIDGGHVTPQTIPVSDGKFTVDGQTYKVR